MTTREELSRVAPGAATLHEVFIVSVPDCLLVRTWSRTPRADAESVGTHLGHAHSVASEVLEALGAKGTSTTVTVETEDALVILTGLARGLVAGLVFDRASPLGLARLQTSDLIEQLRATLKAPAATSTPAASPPAAPAAPPSPPAAPPRAPSSPAGAPRRAAATEDLTEVPRPRFDADSVRTSPRIPRVDLDLPPAAEPTSAPTVAPPAASPPLVAPPVPPSTSAPRRPQPASTTPGAALPAAVAARSRAGRLIEVLRQSAPDPHTALLRLSLRTGIGMDALDRPELLTEQHTEAIAATVRDLLGREVTV